MDDFLKAGLLGVIEGLTEFLPVSSTAHLRLSQSLLGLRMDDEYWKMFAIVIQLGAILSVLIYFRKRLTNLLSTYRFQMKHPFTLVLVAFVVTAIPSFLMSKLIGKHLESMTIIGASLLIGGVAMGAIDLKCSSGKTRELSEVTTTQSVWIGAVQILSAVFPGTSRSMSTIAGGQVVGLTRSTALEFSFFLSIPTMLAATAYDLLKTLVLHREESSLVMDSHGWAVLLTGFTVAFFIAWAVIGWFTTWVRSRSFLPFAVYRVLLGIFVLWASSAGRLG
ncbi:MAG: undecaprenyl-diphosphate phosphatase [Cryobacterium sp.]|nr:undecaprenyl-diphosphate phosphatase [Oligoflexia bacterium]